MKELYDKYKELIIYVIVGFIVTFFSWALAAVGKLFLDVENSSFQNCLNNTINWILTISFAYPLNRILVFKSKNANIIKEYLEFALSRLSTLFLDIFIMWLTVNILNWNYWISKILISTILVMTVNYIFSKLLVFKTKSSLEAQEILNG